jgi:hypothetical protein
MNSGSSGLTLLASCSEVYANEYLDNIPYALEWDDCRIVFCGEIGKVWIHRFCDTYSLVNYPLFFYDFQGNYGKVYLGQLEDTENHIVKVALKTFNVMPSVAILKDLNREAGIMKVRIRLKKNNKWYVFYLLILSNFLFSNRDWIIQI